MFSFSSPRSDTEKLQLLSNNCFICLGEKFLTPRNGFLNPRKITICLGFYNKVKQNTGILFAGSSVIESNSPESHICSRGLKVKPAAE